MAVPLLTSDYTLIHAMDTTTNLSTWGSNALSKWGVTSDIALENALALGLAPASTGDTGIGANDGTTSFDATSNRIFIWVKIVSASGFITTSATTPAGVYIRLTSATSGWTTYYDYYVGGNDVAWCNGDFHLISLDANRTPDRTNGTVTLSTVYGVGVGFNLTNTASKSDVIIVDIMRYGTKVEVTGVSSSSSAHSFTASTNTITRASGDFSSDGFEAGDLIRIAGTASNDGEYTLATVGTTTMTTTGGISDESSVTSNVDAGVTLEDIYQKDGPTDDNWLGIVTKNRDGDYEINGNLLIGDESGSLRTFFVSRGETIIFSDQPLSASSAQLRLKTYESTGNTIFVMGESSGTGDTRVGYNGSTVKQDIAFFSGSTDGESVAEVDLSVAIDTLEVFGSTFQRINGGVSFAADTTHLLTTTSFAECGQVDPNAVEARGLVFSGYAGTAGAMLWNSSIDVELSRFLANSRAIEHPAVGTFTYYDLLFAGNTYDVNNSTNASTDDSYAESNYDTDQSLYSGSTTGISQSFTSSGGILTAVDLYLRKVGSPTGNAVVKLYAHSGTYGTSSVPGTLLATSKNFDVSTLGTSYALTKIEFDDSEFYTLVSSTQYVISIEYSGGGASNYIDVGYDASTPSHGGNAATYVSSWTAQSGWDVCFYAYTGGNVTINVNGSDPATWINSGTPEGTTNINAPVYLTVTGLPTNTEVTLIKDSDGTELDHVENSSGNYVYTYTYAGTIAAHLHLNHIDYVWKRVSNISLGSTDQIIPVELSTERNYSNPT